MLYYYTNSNLHDSAHLRVRDVKAGALVGTDKFGNEYYENKDYIFSESPVSEK